MSDAARARLVGGGALVTGASGGIGRALAVALAGAGLRVLLAGRDAQRLEQVRAGLAQSELHATAVAELSTSAGVEQLAARTNAFAPRGLALLVHAAGAHELGAIETMSAAQLDALWNTNLRAPFLLTGALLPALRLARGDVVFINSSIVSFPRADAAAYAASKAGLRAFADCLRAAVNADGVRVLSVFPGRTATEMQRQQAEREARDYQAERLLQPEDVAQAVVSAIALGETAELTELHVRPRLKS